MGLPAGKVARLRHLRSWLFAHPRRPLTLCSRTHAVCSGLRHRSPNVTHLHPCSLSSAMASFPPPISILSNARNLGCFTVTENNFFVPSSTQ